MSWTRLLVARPYPDPENRTHGRGQNATPEKVVEDIRHWHVQYVCVCNNITMYVCMCVYVQQYFAVVIQLVVVGVVPLDSNHMQHLELALQLPCA